VRNTALDRKWSAPSSAVECAVAGLRSVSLTMVMYSRHGSSGFKLSLNSKSRPVCAGDQKCWFEPSTVLPAAPCTISMQVSRVLGAAAVFCRGVCAGIIESSSGKATATPAPRSNVRREMCFFVRKFISTPSTTVH
jgi:hypothetical protein